MISDSALSHGILESAPIYKVFEASAPTDSFFAKKRDEIVCMLGEGSVANMRIYNYASGVVLEFPLNIHTFEITGATPAEVRVKILASYDSKSSNADKWTKNYCKNALETYNFNNLRLRASQSQSGGVEIYLMCTVD